MLDFGILDTKLGPTGTKIVIALGGGLATHIWSQIRARRMTLSWTANFQKITPPGDDSFASKIQVLVNNQPAQNVYSCQITVLNESIRDVDEFDILFTFQNSFSIQHAQGALSASAKTLGLSPAFQGTVENLRSLGEAERNAHASFNYVMENREFRLPSLNRSASATFTFLISSKLSDKDAKVVMTSEKKGIRLVLRPAQPMLAGVRLLDCVGWGLILTPSLVYVIAHLNLSPVTIAFLCFLVGIFAALFGILFLKLLRFIKNLFG